MDYENLYDKIQDVSNEVHNFVGSELLKVDANVCCPYCRSKNVQFIDSTKEYQCLDIDCNRFFEPPAFSTKTRELLEKLNSCASELADVAHELEEHLAWDAVELPD